MARRREVGYFTPDADEEADIICRPLFVPANFLHIVGGALAELTLPYRWKQAGSLTPEECAEFMAYMLNRWYSEGCCEEMDVRQKPGAPCILEKTQDGINWTEFADLRLCAPALRRNAETGDLEYTTDGGATYTPVPTATPGAPELDRVPEAVRPAPPNPEAVTDELKCSIAINATNALEAAWDAAYSAEFDFLNNIATGITGGATAASLLFPGALIPTLGIALVVNAIRFVFNAISDAEVNSFDEAANERYRCALYALMDNSGTFPASLQEAWADAIASDTENPQAEAVSRMARAVPNETFQWITYASSPVADAEACNCSPFAWCYEFDFTVDDFDFTAWPVAWASAAHVPGEGFTIGGTDSVIIRRDFTPEAPITKMEVDYWRAAPAGPDHETDMYIHGAYQNNANMPAGEVTYTWEGYFNASYIGAGMQTIGGVGSVYIRRMRVYGPDTNPFGVDNC